MTAKASARLRATAKAKAKRGAPTRKRYHHGDLRNALLASVGKVLKEKGVGALTLRETARRAGVSHAAPAHHFGNKAGMLTAFVTEGFRRLNESILADLANLDPSDESAALEALGRGYIRFALASPDQFDLMFRVEHLEKRDPAYKAASDAAFGLLVRAVMGIADAGRLQDDPEAVAVASWSLVHGFASLWLGGSLRSRVKATDAVALATRIVEIWVSRVVGVAPARGRRTTKP